MRSSARIFQLLKSSDSKLRASLNIFLKVVPAVVVQPEMPVAYVRLDAPSNMLLKSVTFETSKLEKLGSVTMLEHPLNMLAKLVTLEVFQLVVPVTLESDEQPSNIRAMLVTLSVSKPAPAKVSRAVWLINHWERSTGEMWPMEVTSVIAVLSKVPFVFRMTERQGSVPHVSPSCTYPPAAVSYTHLSPEAPPSAPSSSRPKFSLSGSFVYFHQAFGLLGKRPPRRLSSQVHS